MKSIYFTIAGTQFRHGSDFLKRGDKVRLIKEPENQYDKEAIRVEMDGLGQIGYVANSTRTVLGESYSAGRIYDKIGKKARGWVRYVVEGGVICELDTRDIKR